MLPKLIHRLRPGQDLSPVDSASVLARARALMQAAKQSPPRQFPLQGKNIGLLCDRDDSEEAELFRDAASALGARVATLRPNLSGSSTALEVQHTARVLGRLYDSIECQEMAAVLVEAIGDEAGVPVYDALASAGHPVAQLAPLLGTDLPLEARRRLLLQATLLCSFG